MRYLMLGLAMVTSVLLERAEADGIVSWGSDDTGLVSGTPTRTDFTAIAAGWYHSLGLTNDGSIVSWGSDQYGCVSDTPSGTGFKAIAAGSLHSLALDADGRMHAWGDASLDALNAPAGTGYTAIAAGFAFGLALTSDGSIVAWGYDDQGQVSDVPSGSGYKAIAAGEYFAVVLDAHGSIVGWGGWPSKNPPGGYGFTAINSGVLYSLALDADGSIVAWGDNFYGQISHAPDGTGFTTVSAGGWHGLALDAEGSIYAWGRDREGQVSGTPSGIGFTEIAAGAFHSVALLPVPEPYVFMFSNNSSWDDGDGAANAADDDAIATDKVALLPGGTATLANYTSYDKGINGLMIDVPSLPGTPTLNDFLFRYGNDDQPYGEDLDDPADDWPWAPDPITIAMRPGEGQDGADRVTLIWEDGAIRNCWLQVTVLATDATGLAENGVFYVGNAVGESANSATDALVNATDEIGARNNPHSPFNPAPKGDPYDFNRDRLVNATDQIIARNNRTSPFTALKLITPPLEGQ